MWNERATALWDLRAEEAHSRPLLGLDTGLPVRLLRGPVRWLLKGERPEQSLILPAIARRGKAIP